MCSEILNHVENVRVKATLKTYFAGFDMLGQTCNWTVFYDRLSTSMVDVTSCCRIRFDFEMEGSKSGRCRCPPERPQAILMLLASEERSGCNCRCFDSQFAIRE